MPPVGQIGVQKIRGQLSSPNPAAWGWIVVLSCIVWFLPNTIKLMGARSVALRTGHEADRPGTVTWEPTWRWLFFNATLASVCILSLSNETQFLYYRF